MKRKTCLIEGCDNPGTCGIVRIVPGGPDDRHDVCSVHNDMFCEAQKKRGRKNWLTIDEWLERSNLKRR